MALRPQMHPCTAHSHPSWSQRSLPGGLVGTGCTALPAGHRRMGSPRVGFVLTPAQSGIGAKAAPLLHSGDTTNTASDPGAL